MACKNLTLHYPVFLLLISIFFTLSVVRILLLSVPFLTVYYQIVYP